MYSESELQDLIGQAQQSGVRLMVKWDDQVFAAEGRKIIESVQVVSGIPGVGVHPMSPMAACERLREARASGVFMPVVRSVEIGPMPRPMPEGVLDAMPSVVATLTDGSVKKLFEFYPDEISFEPAEFVGKTLAQAKLLKFKKDAAYLRDAAVAAPQKRRFARER